MIDRWTDRLSDYLDGDLGPEERRELAAHLETCDACAAALEDLRDLVARARGLRELDASIGVGSDLWPGIEARIRRLPVSTVRPLPDASRGGWTGHRSSHALPQLAAASIAVVVLSAGVLWFASDFGRRDEIARSATESHRLTAVPASNDAGGAALTEIGQLKAVLDGRRDQIDPETFRSLEESVASVETAVEEARRALDADPGNPYIQAHLREMRGRQLELLRRAVVLASGAE
jgi:hypothetical protein